MAAMAQVQRNIPQHGHHVQRLTLQRSPSAMHEHRRLNGTRRRVFEKKLAALQKLKDECDRHPAESSSSFLGHNFHVRVPRVWVACTYLLSGYGKLDSPGKLFEAQLADQSRHALAQKRIAERLRQADRPPSRGGRKPSGFRTRKLLKPAPEQREGLKDTANVLPVVSSIKSWLQQPFVHLAHMVSKNLNNRRASATEISDSTRPLVESLCAES